MTLDMQTLYIVNALAALLTALALYFTLRSHPREFKMGGHWAMGNFMLFIAFMLFYFGDKMPEMVSVIVGNTLFFWAGLLYYMEMKHYASKRAPNSSPHFWGLVMALALVLLAFVVDKPDYINAAVYMGSAAVFMACGFVVLLRKKSIPVRSQWLTGVSFIVVGVFYLLTIAPSLLETYPLSDTFTPQILHNLQLATVFLSVNVLTFGFGLMANDRLMNDIIRLARLDPLTEIYNRRAIMTILQKSFEGFRRSDMPSTIMMVDIDNLKPINEAHSHAAGDDAIVHTAKIIQDEIRMYDSCGRIGGDDFLILLQDADQRIAKRIAGRLGDKINKTPIMFGREEIFLNVTVGVAGFSEHDESYKAVLDRATRSLEQAKKESSVWQQG